MNFDLITILGPTASGKTNIASKLAKDFKGEIISADSRQVYRGMDIGTGKDLVEFKKYNVKYHLIDIAEPFEEYNLFRFKRDFKLSFDEIQKANKIPILVGGTGLYLSAILQSYYLPEIDEKEKKDLSPLSLNQLKNLILKSKPKQHNITDLQDRERMIQAILVERSRMKKQFVNYKYNSLTIGINPERNETKSLITSRLKERIDNGMIEEVKTLLNRGITRERMNYFGLEYKNVTQFIDGKLNYNDMFQKLNSAIHGFAKRQMTWFRKMEKEGVTINWFPPGNYSEIKNFVKEKLGDAKNYSK